jgi:hypothetical protein
MFAGLVLIGCSQEIEGNPSAADGAARSPLPTQTTSAEIPWIASVLPNAADLSRVLGGPEKVHEMSPLVGSLTDLRDTFVGTEITEEQCVGVSAPLEMRTYEAAPVRAVAYATQPDSTFGVVALSSAEEARSLFNAFANVWPECNGRTVVKQDSTGTFNYEINQAVASDSVVSSVIVMSNSRNDRISTVERVLGVADDCIVDVEVPLRDSSTDASGVDNPAAALAELMLAKVAAAPR